MFFDTKVFGKFVENCRKWGIQCPIVPGLMCINAYAGFCKMTKFCKTRVPAELQAKMDSIKDDADAIKAFGVEFGIQMCKDLMEIGVDVLHFYTLNLEKVTFGILKGLGYEVKGVVDESDAQTMVAKVCHLVSSFTRFARHKEMKSDLDFRTFCPSGKCLGSRRRQSQN